MLEASVAMHLRKTHYRMTQIMREKIDEYGLSFRLLHIVTLINKNPEITQKQLSKEMKLTQGAISSSIKRLIKLDIIEQTPLEKDMRYNRLLLTENGKSIIEDCKERLHNRYQDMFFNFTHDELKDFNIFLKKINANLDEITQQDNENI